MPQISWVPLVVSPLKSQPASKKVVYCFICAVVLPSPPAERAWPEVSVSQNPEIALCDPEDPTMPPTFWLPFVSPVL